MRRDLLTCVALLASLCAILARDITTLTGQTYHNVTVTRVDKTGIAITHRDGTAFLAFSVLPAKVRAEFPQLEAAPDPVQPPSQLGHVPEIDTIDGNAYHDVTVTGIEPTGIRISHRDGSGFLDYQNLPDQTRRKYGYNAGTYADGKVNKQRAQADSEAKSRLAAEAIKAAEARTLAARAQATAAVLRASHQAIVLQKSIATRDYSATDYSKRDYGTDRYTGGGYTGGPVQVSGYYKKDGTYVRPHTRSK